MNRSTLLARWRWPEPPDVVLFERVLGDHEPCEFAAALDAHEGPAPKPAHIWGAIRQARAVVEAAEQRALADVALAEFRATRPAPSTDPLATRAAHIDQMRAHTPPPPHPHRRTA